MSRTWFKGLLVVITAASLGPAAADTCHRSWINVPIALGDTLLYAYETRGYGETFVAQQTSIQSISVWRPAAQYWDEIPLQISLMPVDASGTPVMQILATGPTLSIGPGDGISPTEYQFVFDPPLQLPGAGRYFFRIIVPDCFGIFYLLATTQNAYAEGRPWFIFGNRYTCGAPTHPDLQFPDWDLVFHVEFCDRVTATRRKSWGNLKSAFR
jgi:hypothetical protein